MIRNVIAALVIAAAFPTPAFAAERRDFSQDAFVSAQAAGRPILVAVAAWWCPVCAWQEKTIKDVTAAPEFDNLLILRINYDKQKDAWRALSVTKQGTLIAYRGREEAGRIAFQTDKALIAKLIATTVR